MRESNNCKSRAHPKAIGSSQELINRAVYESAGVYRHYLSHELTLSEEACLLKYQMKVAGRDVLDIGVGAGRTTRYLSQFAGCYVGVDYSRVMVSYMKKTMPNVRVQEADFQDLRMFGDCSFDFVFAPNNVIDSLSHEGRQKALSEASRVLRPSGVLAVSSHNINYKSAFDVPRLNGSFNPARLVARTGQFLFSWFNYLRLKGERRETAEYAVLNDSGHYYSCLHYYVSRSVADAQLATVGLRICDVFDRFGRTLGRGEDDSESPSLLYVAQRSSRRRITA
jgi:SAM-dependent methyltransferase